MQRNSACISMLFSLLIALLASSLASAQTVVINYTDRGWYDPTGYHVPFNLDYTAGDFRGVPVCACTDDSRNFFVFDLASVAQPIASAKLALSVPGPLTATTQAGYASPNPSENYELHDIITPIATLLRGTGGVAAHTDLGSGVVYGSRDNCPVTPT